MQDDYLWDGSGTPDLDVERLQDLLSPLAHTAPLDEIRQRKPRRSRAWYLVGSVGLAAAAALAVYLTRTDSVSRTCSGTDGFAFSGEGGDVSCGGARVAMGVLPIGGILETNQHPAQLAIADIGSARLGPQTRVRLERTSSKRHQLVLERGEMHAKVVAPPRLFAVTTKHTDVIDLGCEYTIQVDELGAGRICVASGGVELAARSGVIIEVPAGACASLLAGQRPGVPVGHAANPRVIAAAAAFDRGEVGAIAALLAAAEDRDAITLIAVAAIDAANRREVLDRLYELSPPPDVEITVDTAVADPAMFELWQRDIVDVYRGVYSLRDRR